MQIHVRQARFFISSCGSNIMFTEVGRVSGVNCSSLTSSSKKTFNMHFIKSYSVSLPMS